MSAMRTTGTKTATAVFAGYIALTLCASLQARSQDTKSCSILGDNSSVNSSQLIAKRIPLIVVNGPASCSATVSSKVSSWKAEDLAAFDALSNRECAARTGWVEFDPGTCQAGGPPPICTANHWYQDPAKARVQANADAKQVLDRRAVELRNASCQCWKHAVESEQVSSQQPSIADAFGVHAAPCSYACPPGLSCIQGACSRPPLIQRAIDDAGSKAIDSEAEKIIDDFGGKWAEWYGDHRVAAIISLLTPTVMSLNRDAYRQTISNINTSLARIKRETVELQHSRDSSYSGRGPFTLELDIQATQGSIQQEIALANAYYQGIVRERELPASECYEVLESAHKSLIGLAGGVTQMEFKAPPAIP